MRGMLVTRCADCVLWNAYYLGHFSVPRVLIADTRSFLIITSNKSLTTDD